MERKIGEIFKYNDEWYQCVEASFDEHSCNGCQGCKGTGGPRIFGGECNGNARKDGKFVIFKKLEKVGEPYEHYEEFYQCYKLPMETEIRLLPDNCYPVGKDNLVEIEIKQNKEDMSNTETLWYGPDKKEAESLKLSNLKPFSLEAAKAGKPVCTRDGRKARIISCSLRNKNFPIAAIVEDEEENVYQFEANGVCDEHDENLDLMMLPEKKEGWVNVYRDCDGANITKDDNIYSSKDAAIASAQIIDRDNYVATTIIKWEA